MDIQQPCPNKLIGILADLNDSCFVSEDWMVFRSATWDSIASLIGDVDIKNHIPVCFFRPLPPPKKNTGEFPICPSIPVRIDIACQDGLGSVDIISSGMNVHPPKGG